MTNCDEFHNLPLGCWAVTEVTGRAQAPSRFWLGLATLLLLGLAVAQGALAALRGTGILRQPLFLAGVGASGVLGLAALDLAAAPPPGGRWSAGGRQRMGFQLGAPATTSGPGGLDPFPACSACLDFDRAGSS